MFDWIKAWQIGSQVLEVIRKFLAGESVEATIPISVKGHRFVLYLRLDPATGQLSSQLLRR